jgi:hypothetical protein
MNMQKTGQSYKLPLAGARGAVKVVQAQNGGTKGQSKPITGHSKPSTGGTHAGPPPQPAKK